MKILPKISLFFLLISLLFSCYKISYLNNPKITLKFSTDTLEFDTVFTNIGSATRIFKVYNPYSQTIKIDKIFLARGKNSPFRININGVPTTELDNVSIPSLDSIYIFVDVTITPQKNYLIELDSVVFDIAGKLQSVKLLAVGWDVNLLKKQIISQDQTWTPNKPYLIFDYLVIDTNTTLRIMPGTKVFLNRGAVLYVAGSLQSTGSLDSPVVFASDRLEQDYRNIPGQWGGIVLARSSFNNRFLYTEIRGSVVGISADSVTDTINIYNSVIWHQSYACVFASCSNINIYGSLLADAGWYVLGFIKGGTYRLINNTIANFYSWGTIRQTPAIAVTNYQIINDQPIFWQPVSFTMYNTIVYGSQKDEFILSPAHQWDNFTYDLQNNLIKTSAQYQCKNCILNQDPQFNAIDKYDFTLTENSPAKDKANANFIIRYKSILEQDLLGNNRLNDGQPDIGAFEYSGQR